MSVKTRIKDLVEECDGAYPSFYIRQGFLYDSEDDALEGVVKVGICRHSNSPEFRVFVSKMDKWFCSGPVEVSKLDDPSERLKIINVLDEVRVALLM